MASKYGAVFDIINTHHVQTKAKLDALLAKNSEIDLNTDAIEAKHDVGNASLASVDGKIVACDTGAVVVASSALPSGAATESSLAAQSAKIVACDTGSVVVSSSALPSGAATEASLSAQSAKIVACDTGSVAVSSSVLPAGASDSAKQDEIKALITATNSALAGTLSVSSSGGSSLSKSDSTPVSSEAILGQALYVSSEIDVSASRHLALVGSSTDVWNSHEVDLLVSPVSGGTFYKTSHSGYFLDGEFHLHVQNHPYKYVKIQVKNADAAAAMSANFTVHLLSSD
tara:strand:- start:29 stop:886 length:858 start_codon:yes stop_codon:yes gene_type:complete